MTVQSTAKVTLKAWTVPSLEDLGDSGDVANGVAETGDPGSPGSNLS